MIHDVAKAQQALDAARVSHQSRMPMPSREQPQPVMMAVEEEKSVPNVIGNAEDQENVGANQNRARKRDGVMNRRQKAQQA